MRISIADKKNFTDFSPVEVNSLQEFVEYATQYNYSTGIFKDNYRNKANFETAECIAIDVDNDDPSDNYTIAEAKEKFAPYRHIIMPSKSHQKEKNGRVADRFRVILFLERAITNPKDFTATWVELLNFYPAADKACKDASRFYYPSPECYSVQEEGKAWPVTEYVEPKTDDIDIALGTDERGQLSKLTLDFLTFGAAAGHRNDRLFKAAKDMQEQGYAIEECKKRVSAMISLTANWGTNYLNDKDIQTIDSAYREEPIHPPRKLDVSHRQSVFKFQTVREMAKEAGQVKWLADKLLTEAGFSMIVGPPKAGKSTLVRQLVKTVCQGGEFLGRKVSTGSVVYLSFEEQPEILKEQFNTVGIKDDDPIFIHTGAVFDDRALSDLESAILDFEPKLVILDTLFDISQLEDINSYKAVKDALSRIRLIARRTGAHILGVHHSNKLGGFMGSQAIYGAVDTMIRFVPTKDRRFLFSTGKYGDHFNDHEIHYDPTTETYSLGAQKERETHHL